MDPADLRFEQVLASGRFLHCFLGQRYLGRIVVRADCCVIDGAAFASCRVADEEKAKEVMRMWMRREFDV